MPWIDITWEEKRFYTNTTSTSYGNPVQALISAGGPKAEDLTAEGRKHFGIPEKPTENPFVSTKKSSKSSSSSKSGNSGNGNGASKKAVKATSANKKEEKEERPPQPLSDQERYWLELDIESYEEPETHVYIKKVVDHYYKVKKLSPELDNEIEWREQKLDEFFYFMVDFPTPDDPVEFFLTYATLDYERNNHSFSVDNIYGINVFGLKKEPLAQKILFRRMMNIVIKDDNPNSPLRSKEVLDMVWDIKDSSNICRTPVYHTVVGYYYEDLIKRGDFDAFKQALDLMKEGKYRSGEYFGKFQLPISSKEDAIAVCKLLDTDENRKHSEVKKKLKNLKELIISNEYTDDAYLQNFVAMQNERELREAAKTYKITKYVSLALCVIMSLPLFLLPIILWLLIFKVNAIHDKIAFLNKGALAVKAVNEIDNKNKQ